MYHPTLRQLTAVLTLFVLWLAARSAPAGDRETLIGTWEITTFQDDGRNRLERLGARAVKKPGSSPRVAKLVFTADACYILRGDGRREMASGLANAGFKACQLNESTLPKSIDIDGFTGKENDKTKTYLGIYKITGDELTICYCEQGKTRPTKFESDGANNLVVARRASKEALPLPK